MKHAPSSPHIARRAGARRWLALLAAAGTVIAAHADDIGRGVPLPPNYQHECGACHLAYPPGLLPAASWQRLMANLPRHFGTDASLDAATGPAIANWLTANAGTYKKAREAPPQDRISHADWMAAYAEVTGLAPDATPAWVQVPHRFKEDYLVDGRLERVLDLAGTRHPPRRALTVTAGWPVAPGAPTSYAFEDRSTDPAIETARRQVNGYRILDYGPAIVIDGIHGVTGRATSGLLGVVFDVLGHARAVQTRFAFAADGTQVSRTTARKGLTLTQAIAILPDGKVLPSLPADRADLAAVDAMLAGIDVQVSYRPVASVPPPAP